MNKLKCNCWLLAMLMLLSLLISGLGGIPLRVSAQSNTTTQYSESYRNQLAYSASEGWNNDPNGLLYADGVYHMYYQYNYDQRTDSTANGWGNMSWGHATSTDLVHWTEQAVAIPAYQTVDGKYYAMMFSGSAVYDEYNTSGLFKVDSSGKVLDGQGIVALLTQPEDGSGIQRQILAYSNDDGNSFTIYGEILGKNDDGGQGDNEFRDPRVFYSQTHKMWLMAVGGGSVRMYSSHNLLDWQFIGSTGYWGECPDLSRFEVDGEEKYVMVLSPEDKANSHIYNKTDRTNTFYPAEYYVVGHLDDKGLFVGETQLMRFSYGLDSYAFQSFNNTPDGQVYGVSWSACWKNVGEYEQFRQTHNGGMTIVTTMQLTKQNGEYVLQRSPVADMNKLHSEQLVYFDGTVNNSGYNFNNIQADIYQMEAVVDFSGSSANKVQLALRTSVAEQTLLLYDKNTETLTLDRSQSSLLAKTTNYYTMEQSMSVPLDNNKLNISIYVDRAFITVFANGRSLFSAIFPSAISNGMKITADNDIALNTTVWRLDSIFNTDSYSDNVLLTSTKLDMAVGDNSKVVASSFAKDFDATKIEYEITQGSEYVNLTSDGAVANVNALGKGYCKVNVKYNGLSVGNIDIFIYNNGYSGNVQYNNNLFSYCRPDDNGLALSRADGDGFLFADHEVTDFVYSLDVSLRQGDQAFGMVFGVSDNYYDYYVATVDFKDNLIKLWRNGVGDVAPSVPYSFAGRTSCRITVQVFNKTVSVYIDNSTVPNFSYNLTDYDGGKIGVNVYKAEAVINNVMLANNIYRGTKDTVFAMNVNNVIKVVNVTDNSYKLKDTQYRIVDNALVLDKNYLSTLDANSQYVFRVVTSDRDYTVSIITDFEGATATSNSVEYKFGEQVVITLNGINSVLALQIDGESVDKSHYTVNGSTLTISEQYVDKLSAGKHTLTILSDNGRPQVQFSIAQPIVDDTDIELPNHIFFYIDMAIFAIVVFGYAGISIYKKVRSRKSTVK